MVRLRRFDDNYFVEHPLVMIAVLYKNRTFGLLTQVLGGVNEIIEIKLEMTHNSNQY